MTSQRQFKRSEDRPTSSGVLVFIIPSCAALYDCKNHTNTGCMHINLACLQKVVERRQQGLTRPATHAIGTAGDEEIRWFVAGEAGNDFGVFDRCDDDDFDAG